MLEQDTKCGRTSAVKPFPCRKLTRALSGVRCTLMSGWVVIVVIRPIDASVEASRHRGRGHACLLHVGARALLVGYSSLTYLGSVRKATARLRSFPPPAPPSVVLISAPPVSLIVCLSGGVD